MDKGKLGQQSAASWLDFLFDESGDRLKKHLEDESAEPAAMQLIVQFLDRARVATNNVVQTQEGVPIENPRAKRLHHLALIIASHQEWNLQILEDSLSLQWQHLLFTALMKSAPALEGFKPADGELSSLDRRSAMIIIIYYRWVVRTFVLNLSSVRQLNNGVTADAAITDSIMKSLEDQLPSAVKTLEQVQRLSNDLELPEPSINVEPRKSQNGEVSGEGESSTQGDPTTCNGYTANKEEKMEVCADEARKVIKVTKEEIIAQVAFDLGTLYFYQEKFEDARTWFGKCADVKCSRSSFFLVDEERLHGFYAACCGLLGLASDTASITTTDQPSLVVQLQNCRASDFKGIVPILIQDNLSLELPMDYRRSLVCELRDFKATPAAQPEGSGAVSIEWEVAACNAIRDILQGRTVEPAFWTKLKNCTQPQMERILSLCAQSVSIKMETSEQDVCNKNLETVRSFVRLLCSCVESMDAWAILKNSEARPVLFNSEVEDDLLNATRVRKPRKTPFEWKSGDHLPSSQVGDDTMLQVGLLQSKLRASFDPDEISNLLEELHKLEKGKKHSEHFVCLVYKSHLDEIKEPVLHDLLHTLFSKATHCFSMQEYGAAGNLLAYGLGRMSDVSSRTASPASVEKVRTALHQELLVLDIAQDNNNRRSEEITNKVKSYLWQTSQNRLHDLKPHVEEQVTAHLINSKEWEFLSELKLDENTDNSAIGYRLLGRLVAATCCSLSKPQIWRKAARSLWDGVCQIFSTTGQQKRPQDGMAMSVHRGLNGINMSNLIRFVENLKEETALSVLISCLVKLHFASSEEESESHKEVFSAYSHLWPTTVTNRSLLNNSQVATTLSAVVKHAISVQVNNPSWLHTIGDLYIASCNFSAALKCFLEAGATASSLFTMPVPNSVWDDQVYKKMITCCSALKAHIQAAVLCQCTEPRDYSTAFKAVQQAVLSSEDAMDYYYDFFWDITVLEYLVHIHTKRGQNDKKQLAVQAISQPELNMFNSPEILQHSENRRKSSFFRAMAKQYL